MRRIAIVAGLAALGLSACSNTAGGGMAGNHNVCLPFPATTTANGVTTTTTTTPPGQPIAAPPLAGDPTGGVEDCLHRWAYALAGSSDDATQVANATLAACGPAIARWNQAALAPGDGGGPPEAPSLMTGQQTNPIAEHFIFAQGRALFYVVQARAGKCAAPPMTNGAPTGLVD